MKDILFRFESNRPFAVYSYATGHGLLLLRTIATNLRQSRIDVLFQDVRAMELRCSWFDGIRIEETEDIQHLSEYASRPAELMEPGIRIYKLLGSGWHGFVLGGIVSVAEDQLGPRDPSPLLTPRE